MALFNFLKKNKTNLNDNTQRNIDYKSLNFNNKEQS